MASLSDGSRIRIESREMAFPQPLSLSLEFSACQKTSEAEGELEAPGLPRSLFWNWIPPANMSLSFRQEFSSLS